VTQYERPLYGVQRSYKFMRQSGQGAACEGSVYGFYTAVRSISSPFLRADIQTPFIRLNQELLMDIVFIAASAGLWGLMVLLVWGFRKLEKPQGGRS
jgi:hypothetical protein